MLHTDAVWHEIWVITQYNFIKEKISSTLRIVKRKKKKEKDNSEKTTKNRKIKLLFYFCEKLQIFWVTKLFYIANIKERLFSLDLIIQYNAVCEKDKSLTMLYTPLVKAINVLFSSTERTEKYYNKLVYSTYLSLNF